MSGSFVNNYQPPPLAEPIYGPEPYEINFVFPIPSSFDSDRVRLVPLIPRIHALGDFLKLLETMRKNPGWVMLVILDKKKPDDGFGGGSIAGIIGLIRASGPHLNTEIGGVVILPAYQRTHITHTRFRPPVELLLEPPERTRLPGVGPEARAMANARF